MPITRSDRSESSPSSIPKLASLRTLDPSLGLLASLFFGGHLEISEGIAEGSEYVEEVGGRPPARSVEQSVPDGYLELGTAVRST